MNKAVILSALERIELDADDPETVCKATAVIRCEMRDVKMPPLVDLDGVAVEFRKGCSYVLFLQHGSVPPAFLEDLLPGGDFEVAAVFMESAGVPLRDMIHVISLKGDMVAYVRPGTVDLKARVPGLRFVEVYGSGPLADSVLLRPDPLTAALEICEDPAWADGVQIAEQIRRL